MSLPMRSGPIDFRAEDLKCLFDRCKVRPRRRSSACACGGVSDRERRRGHRRSVPGGSDAPTSTAPQLAQLVFRRSDIVLRIAEMQAQVELGRLLPKENLLPSVQMDDISEDELAQWRVLGNFEALVTLDFTATDLSDAVQPFKSLLKADIVRQPR